jgi:hypothetical protein
MLTAQGGAREHPGLLEQRSNTFLQQHHQTPKSPYACNGIGKHMVILLRRSVYPWGL